MGLFGFGSKGSDVVDLAERYRQKKNLEATSEAGTSIGTTTTNPSDFSDTDTAEERRKKLAKRIVDIMTKLEDISNQIYHIQQRLEVLERKADIRTDNNK